MASSWNDSKSLRQLPRCYSPAFTPPSHISSESPHTFPHFHFSMQVRYFRLTSSLFQRQIARPTTTSFKHHFNLQTRTNKRQYTMAQQAMHGHSAACCNIPPIVSQGYEAKGKYETIGGLKTCELFSIANPCHFPSFHPSTANASNEIDVTGPANATKAILYIYDIFGYFPQSLQGADILSTSDKDNQYLVFMPDWFEGKYCDISW